MMQVEPSSAWIDFRRGAGIAIAFGSVARGTEQRCGSRENAACTPDESAWRIQMKALGRLSRWPEKLAPAR
jgi:hypothetical protein